MFRSSETNAPESNEFMNKTTEELEQEIENADSSVLDTKLIVGNPDAPVTIVEYFDYKCPNCNKFHETTKKEIDKEFVSNGTVKFELRTTPVFGPDSGRSARGLYCAAEQAKLSEYHNAVLEYMWTNYYEEENYSAEFEDILTNQVLTEINSTNGINTSELIECIESLKYNPTLDRDLLLAAEDGVRGTPGFTIGEQSFVGNQPYSVFKTLIEAQI